MEQFDAIDKIASWDTFFAQLSLQECVVKNQLLVKPGHGSVTLLKIDDCLANINFSVTIGHDFVVKAIKNSSAVDVRNLLGFQCRLSRFSQLSEIINHVNNADGSLKGKLDHHVQSLQAICDDEELLPSFPTFHSSPGSWS